MEHMLVAKHYWGSDEPWDPSEMYIFLQLRPNGYFLKRLWIALKYICGKSSDSAYWADTMLDKEQARDLRTLLDNFINDRTHEEHPSS
jgi:hypothetical protein